MQRDRAISIRLLHLVGAYVTANGLDFELLLLACGIDLSVARLKDGDIRFSDFLNVLDTASQKLKADDLGVRLAETLPSRLTGIYHYITQNAATLRDEAAASCKYIGLITNAYTAGFSEADGRGMVTLNFSRDTGPRILFVDLQVAAIVKRIRDVLQDPALPIRVEVERPAPEKISSFERVIGPDLHFGAAFNRISFSQSLLSRPIPGADPHLFEELQRVGDHFLKLKSREDNILEVLSEFIANALPHGTATTEMASKTLNLSERTLQRNLAAANTTFTKLVDETRQRMAKHYLYDTNKSLTEVAFLLGFSELSAFSRAAKAWFGDSPSAIRKASRPGWQDNEPTNADV